MKLSDGSVRHLNQNKLFKYVQPIRTMEIIYEMNEEFEEVQHALVEQERVTNQDLEINVSSNHQSRWKKTTESNQEIQNGF